MEEMLGKREASGWVAGSVSLLGNEKDKTSVAMTILVLRGHPTVEVFFAEAPCGGDLCGGSESS